MLKALAFVPQDHVIQAYEELCDTDYYVDHADELFSLLRYFELTWIGVKRGNIRKSPKYELALWNAYSTTTNNVPRTNNRVERWHLRFAKLVGASHASVWKLFKVLQKEQTNVEMKLERWRSGVDDFAPSKKQMTLEERLNNVIENYDSRDLVSTVLLRICHCNLCTNNYLLFIYIFI